MDITQKGQKKEPNEGGVSQRRKRGVLCSGKLHSQKQREGKKEKEWGPGSRLITVEGVDERLISVEVEIKKAK